MGTPPKVDACVREAASKEAAHAAGVLVYLTEELGDARLRCLQLKRLTDEARQVVEKSEARDHIYEVAAHLLHGIPDTLNRLEKALQAAAMAAARLDYEEIKQDLRPEKGDELERVMDDIRIQFPQRRSAIDFKAVADKLLGEHHGSEADDLHYRAYLRAVSQGQPSQHLVGKFPGAARAQQDLIDEAGKAPKKASTMPTRAQLLDYLFNGYEHAPSDKEAVEELVGWGCDDAFAKDLLHTWNAKNPTIQHIRDIMAQQEAAEKLVDAVAREHHVHLKTSTTHTNATETPMNVKQAEPQDGKLRCDMKSDCKEPVSHIDNRGFVYCAKHGAQRKAGGTPCRALRPAEIKKLEADQTIRYGATPSITSKLQSRQEAILKKWLDAGGSGHFFDDLPPSVQNALRHVKDQETLESDVDRWIGDNNNPHLKSKWATKYGETMNAKQAAEAIQQIAQQTEATGTVPVADALALIASLERGNKTASGKSTTAARLKNVAAKLNDGVTGGKRASRVQLAAILRKIVADSVAADPLAGAGEDFQKVNPAISDAEVAKIDEEHEKNKDVVKDKSATDAPLAGAGEDFQKHNPAITDEEAKKIDEEHEKNKDVVKDKNAADAPAAPLVAFQVAFATAKAAMMAATRGNERLACVQGLGTISNMAAALAGIAPEHAPALQMLGDKAFRLLPVIKSEATKEDLLKKPSEAVMASNEWAAE